MKLDSGKYRTAFLSLWIAVGLQWIGFSATAQSHLVNRTAEYALSTCKNNQPWALVCRGNAEKIMETAAKKEVRTWEGENQIVVCQNRDGKLELRTLLRTNGSSEFPKDQTTHAVESQLNEKGEPHGFLIQTSSGMTGPKYYYSFAFPSSHEESEIKVSIRTVKWSGSSETTLVCNRIGHWDDSGITQKKFLAGISAGQNSGSRSPKPVPDVAPIEPNWLLKTGSGKP